jgi:multisubunit Na+/H+ antiporter MnhF subunit
MTQILDTLLVTALIIHSVLIATCIWRVWRGENAIDRLVAADAIGNLSLAIVALLALLNRSAQLLDTALGLAALALIGTIALARFAANQRWF